jgi:hypothetical protein
LTPDFKTWAGNLVLNAHQERWHTTQDRIELALREAYQAGRESMEYYDKRSRDAGAIPSKCCASEGHQPGDHEDAEVVEGCAF